MPSLAELGADDILRKNRSPLQVPNPGPLTKKTCSVGKPYVSMGCKLFCNGCLYIWFTIGVQTEEFSPALSGTLFAQEC